MVLQISCQSPSQIIITRSWWKGFMWFTKVPDIALEPQALNSEILQFQLTPNFFFFFFFFFLFFFFCFFFFFFFFCFFFCFLFDFFFLFFFFFFFFFFCLIVFSLLYGTVLHHSFPVSFHHVRRIPRLVPQPKAASRPPPAKAVRCPKKEKGTRAK